MAKRTCNDVPDNDSKVKKCRIDNFNISITDMSKKMDNAMEHILCPISQEIPIDPVFAKDGVVYERKSIENWFKNNNTSPFTRKKIDKELIPATQLRNMFRTMVESGIISGSKVENWIMHIEKDNNYLKLKDMFNKGDGKACWYLGNIIIVNKMKNFNENALSWYKRGAELKNIESIGACGLCYENGIGVEKNYSKAMYYYLQAANAGSIRECRVIGDIFYTGRLNMDIDKKEAKKWYEKAIEQHKEQWKKKMMKVSDDRLFEMGEMITCNKCLRTLIAPVSRRTIVCSDCKNKIIPSCQPWPLTNSCVPRSISLPRGGHDMGVWVQYKINSDGPFYYYNAVLNRTQLDKPPKFQTFSKYLGKD
jgi:hypothetical protein